MKKKIFPLALVATLLVGCSSSSTDTFSSEVSDGDTSLVSIDDVEIKKNDVYHYLLEQFGSSEVLSLALTYIAEEELTDTDAVQKRIDEAVANYSNNSSGGTLADAAKQYGLSSEQEYIDKVISVGIKQTMLKEKYINDNYDSLIDEYKVKYLKTITLDTESAALSIIDQVKDGSDFDTLMNENSGSDVGLVTTESSSVDSNIIDKLDKFSKDGIYSKVIKTSESKYAVIFVYNTDKKELKEDIIKNLSSIDAISKAMEQHYLDAYNFKVNESVLDKEIESAYSEDDSE